MSAEVISIGDELTSGQRLNTNSQWLSQRLAELGYNTTYHTTVADDLEANRRVFREALSRADVVIATGGLGPTDDDLTREAIAATTNLSLELDSGALAHIQALFARRGRGMPETNRRQAMFPQGSFVIPNPNGTAPGIDLSITLPGQSASRIFALPGVPVEMREMWDATVAPALSETSGSGRCIVQRQINCFGAGESDIEQRLPELVQRGRNPTIGITASKATITLRIISTEESIDRCHAKIQPVAETIYNCLGDLVFGEGNTELQHVVMDLLASRQTTMATAEVATGGLLAAWLNDIPTSSEFYRGGWVVNDVKAAAIFSGAISGDHHSGRLATAKMARQLAIRCREQFNTDLGLAISGFPEPVDDKTPAVDEFYIALADNQKVEVFTRHHAGHPDILRERTVKQTLDVVRHRLLSTNPP